MTAYELRQRWVDAFGPLMPPESRFQFWESFYASEAESSVLLWNFIKATTEPSLLPLTNANRVAEWIHRQTLQECHKRGLIEDYNEGLRLVRELFPERE